MEEEKINEYIKSRIKKLTATLEDEIDEKGIHNRYINVNKKRKELDEVEFQDIEDLEIKPLDNEEKKQWESKKKYDQRVKRITGKKASEWVIELTEANQGRFTKIIEQMKLGLMTFQEKKEYYGEKEALKRKKVLKKKDLHVDIGSRGGFAKNSLEKIVKGMERANVMWEMMENKGV